MNIKQQYNAIASLMCNSNSTFDPCFLEQNHYHLVIAQLFDMAIEKIYARYKVKIRDVPTRINYHRSKKLVIFRY